MNETVITWSAPNFATIGLMLISWGLILGIACMVYAKYAARKEGVNDNSPSAYSMAA